jgi:lipopolysaccharide cholinephosphotransferase
MASYDIRPLQLRILDILLALHKVCEEKGLRYYIIAGTLLGAVRHKGFIPWDDDLDIGMPRKDYDLLMANAKEWLPEPFEVINCDTNEDYPLPYAKIQDSSTTLIEKLHRKYVGGIFMDIFPLDGMSENPIKQRIHFARYSYLKKILYFLYRDPYRHGHGPSSWVPLMCRKIYTRKEVQDKIRRMQKTYDFDSSKLVVDYDDGRKGIMSRSKLGIPTPILFEGISVMGVEHPDAYLSQKYGDYMTIPKGDHQRQHNYHLLDLEKPYREYTNKE